MKVEELFIPIPLWENYAVSNYGRVINLLTGYELTPTIRMSNGRLRVRFHVLGAFTGFYVDELVAQAFFVNYHPGIDIYYKNHNKMDCTVLNLTFDPKYKEEDG